MAAYVSDMDQGASVRCCSKLENKIWTIIHPAIVVGGCQSEMSARQLYCDAESILARVSVGVLEDCSIAMVSIGQCGTICDCAESQTPPAVKSLGIGRDCDSHCERLCRRRYTCLSETRVWQPLVVEAIVADADARYLLMTAEH